MDRFEISILRDFYGTLLTEKQSEMLKMRYDEDLSFGEIAEITGVSRQAVLDSINKGEKHLAEFEEHLKCVDKQRRIFTLIDKASENGNALNRAELISILAEIKTILEE